jgi:hypothetical protein
LWVSNQTYTQAFVTSTPFTVFLPNSTEDFQGVHKDASPNMDREADYGGWPISVYLSSEYMDFGTSKRKKIHRLTLEGDNRNNWSLWDESLRIFWKKDEMGDSVGSQQPTDNDEWTFGKTIPLPTPKRPRWSIANLGSARTWAFGFWIVTASNIQLRSWEVEVSKGAS